MKLKQMIAVLSSVAMLLCGCSSANAKDQTYSDTLYDTVVKVQILDPVNENVMSGLKSLCQKYNTMFSMYVEGSDIYNINHAQGMPVDVSSDTATLIKKGIYYGDLSNGSFDITIGSVSQLWDFTSGSGTVPDADAIASALSHVNYKNISVSDNIGIQKPFGETGEPITSIKVANKSVVTTGIYQRYFEADGKIYHHILDPRTGYPCENTLYSDTIITDSSLTADALSTVCYLMGYEAANDLIDQLENVDALFITNDNEIHYTKNFLR